MPRKYFEKFPLDEIILPKVLEEDLNDLPPFGKKLAKEIYQVSSGKNFNGTGISEHKLIVENNQWRKGIQAYLATINFADKYLGKFLDALDKSKYADNTIVVLWSDHGFHLGEKRTFSKFSLWEEATRTPFIILDPRKKEGQGKACVETVGFKDAEQNVFSPSIVCRECRHQF